MTLTCIVTINDNFSLDKRLKSTLYSIINSSTTKLKSDRKLQMTANCQPFQLKAV